MSRPSSVAPKERINIKYVPATGDQSAQIELPLKTVVVGDFTGRADETPLEARKAINVNKDNFNEVFSKMDLSLDVDVNNTLDESDPDASLRTTLKFESIEDFKPDSIARQVPELNSLLELREALSALKGPLGNMPAFRKALSELLDDPVQRDALLKQLSDEKSK